MQKIQEDLSGPPVIDAIEANLFAMFSQFCHWPRVEVHDDSTMLWLIGPATQPADLEISPSA